MSGWRGLLFPKILKSNAIILSELQPHPNSNQREVASLHIDSATPLLQSKPEVAVVLRIQEIQRSDFHVMETGDVF